MTRAWGPIRTLALGVALAAGAGRAGAEETALAERAAALERETVAALEDLAEWCTRGRLFRRRDLVYEEILRHDPDHARARQKLGFVRGEDDAWVRSPRHKGPPDMTREGLAEFEGRLAKARDAHAAALAALAGSATGPADLAWARRRLQDLAAERPSDQAVGGALRSVLLRAYVAAQDAAALADLEEAAAALRERWPEDRLVRATLREEPVGGRWLLAESVRALADAPRLGKVAADALAAAKAAPAEPTPRERAVELVWAEGRATPHARVVGTSAVETLGRLALLAEAAGPVFQAALAREPVRREGLTVYVFDEKGEFDFFLDHFPVVDNPSLRDRKTLKLDLVFTSGRGMAVRENPPEAQADLLVGTLFSQLLTDTLLPSGSPRGWHAEGISRYLTWRLAGTRLSVAVTGTYAGHGGGREVPGSGDAWLVQARALLQRDPKVGLDLLLGLGLDAFGPREALLAYAFSVYLLEGFEAAAADFLRTLDETADPDRVSRQVLRMPLAVLERRLVRWLDEVAVAREAPPPAPPR